MFDLYLLKIIIYVELTSMLVTFQSTHGTNIIQIENEFKVSDVIDGDDIKEYVCFLCIILF